MSARAALHENLHHAISYLHVHPRSSFGIVAALNAGADIVLCGRVADASPFIGLAAWAYGWSRDNLDALAGAFVAGHIGECVSWLSDLCSSFLRIAC